MIKLILFDMAGIIHNSLSSSYVDFLSDISGKSRDEVIGIIKPIIMDLSIATIGLPEAERLIATGLKIKETDVQFLSFYKGNLKVDKSVVALIRSLRQNYKIGTLTNNEENRFSYALNIIGNNLFDFPFSSSRLHFRKPDSKIFELVYQKTNIPPDEILYIDDDEKNLVVARELGFKTIKFESVEKLKRDMISIGIKV